MKNLDPRFLFNDSNKLAVLAEILQLFTEILLFRKMCNILYFKAFLLKYVDLLGIITLMQF